MTSSFRPVTEIIVHCTATRPEWMQAASLADKTAEVRRWHVQDRGWKDIGYHYLIDRDGQIGAGRPLEQVGAHTQGHNTGTIGVTLIGGHGSAETDPFSKNYTPAQDAALRRVLANMQKRFGPLKVSGHNQYAAKACPGFNVPTWLNAKATPQAPQISPPTAKPASGGVNAHAYGAYGLLVALIAAALAYISNSP